MAKEDTQEKAVQVTQTEAEQVEAWLKAKDAPEPGEFIKDRAIRDPELPEGVGMKLASVKSAGYVFVYHTKTGDRSIVNRNMLRTQLRKKLEDGSNAFSLMPPVDKEGNVIKPIAGTIKCMLHQESPNRADYDRMGFAVCKKANLPSLHAQEQHMRHRHHIEFESIEKIKKDTKEAEDREFQRNLYQKLAISLEQKQKETFKCESCESSFTSRIALEGHKRSHNK